MTKKNYTLGSDHTYSQRIILLINLHFIWLLGYIFVIIWLRHPSHEFDFVFENHCFNGDEVIIEKQFSKHGIIFCMQFPHIYQGARLYGA